MYPVQSSTLFASFKQTKCRRILLAATLLAVAVAGWHAGQPSKYIMFFLTIFMWILVSFGAYLLGLLGLQLIRLQDRQDAYDAMMKVCCIGFATVPYRTGHRRGLVLAAQTRH
ncbi:hypothetical protein PMAC_001586 [Pneumocystis sp. 'macacae']|nr:hypothetical protein PMAC_001586 [Pneumocystis sp. 'macacae']